MRFMAIFLVLALGSISLSSHAAIPKADELTQKIEKANKNEEKELADIYRVTLNYVKEKQHIKDKLQAYQNVIENFTELSAKLKSEIAATSPPTENDVAVYTIAQLDTEISFNNKKLSVLSRSIKEEEAAMGEIIDSLTKLPERQAELRKSLNDAELRLAQFKSEQTPLATAKNEQLRTEIELIKSHLNLLNLDQISASKRQELMQLQIELYKVQFNHADKYGQLLRDQLNLKRQNEAQQALESSLLITENNADIPSVVRTISDENMLLSQSVAQSVTRLNQVTEQQRTVVSQISQVKQTLDTLDKQAQWLKMSTGLGEALRIQLSRMPEKPKPQQLDREMADIRLKRLHYDDQLDKLNQRKNDLLAIATDALTTEQSELFEQQVKSQRELLASLISTSDSLVLEITKLKVSNNQLIDALSEVKDAAHRYFFWVADVNPLTLDFPIDVAKDIHKVLSLNTFSELASASLVVLNTPISFLIMLAAVLFTIFGLRAKRRFLKFLDRTANKIGNVTQDRFFLTTKTVFFSLLIAAPIPVLWAAAGYVLQEAWDYPVAVALGSGVNAVSPILWAFMITASFAQTKGLFIAHFNWMPDRVASAMKYYRLSVWVIIPLVMALVAFDTYNEREFFATLGRICFILLCVALIIVTRSIHKANVPIYLDKKGSGDNLFNDFLWMALRFAPWLAMIAACVGYLSTSLALLGRLEASVVIWFSLLLIYYIIRRWMFIQRRRIEFDRAKQRRAERIAQRQKNQEENAISNTPNTDNADVIDEPIIDLDVISARSLQLIRSILSMVAIISIILLWSELHSAFSFLENITLWSSSTILQGVEQIQRITLASLIISILTIVLTAQFVKDLPALLELGILQHLELAPGTGYAISTVTKYVVLMVGTMVAASFLGIDWSKVQWLVAALGLGIGFGLQEIFANFISGLILLFEKPIRIGDTVTIRDLTGTITKINTRATTLVDWDRKEIVMPNKAFITEQLINWSLSDSVTRIVITVPAEVNADSRLVIDILMDAASQCAYVLKDPPHDAFLVDIQEGIQLFELRVFAAETGHRMPLRNEIHQLILEGYRKHNLVLPFPPFQARMNSLGRKSARRTYSEGGL